MRNPRIAALSFMAAMGGTGGMFMPASIFWLLQSNLPGQDGWGTVMATDTAFVIGAILLVAIGYGGKVNWELLALAGVGIAIVRGMALIGIHSLVIYFVVGVFVWFAVDMSGIHATVTGVVLGLMTPTESWVSDHRLRSILNRVIAYPPGNVWSGDSVERDALRMAEVATRETLSPVERLEVALHPWVRDHANFLIG